MFLPMKNFLVLVLLVGSLVPAQAREIFRANLAPRDGVSTSATGFAIFELDDTETQIQFTVEYADLSSPEIAAHVHRANGEIVYPLPGGNPKVGVWQNPGPLAVFQLRQGQLFVLVHSEANPGGEIRGDLSDLVVPIEPDSFGAVKALYGEAR
jgi:hypothetical protein